MRLVGVLWLAILLSCSSPKRKQIEILQLLAAANAIRLDQSSTQRYRALERLERLVLTAEDLKKIQARCLSAHRALLAAERAQHRTRDQLSSLEAMPAQQRTREQLRQTGTALAHSTEALTKAQKLLPVCQKHLNKLSFRPTSG